MILNFLWRKLRTTEKQNIPFLGGDQGLVERKQIHNRPQIQGVKASKELEALEVWTFPAKVTCCSLARRLGIAFKLEFEFWEFLALAQKGRENEKERTKSKFIQHWRFFWKQPWSGKNRFLFSTIFAANWVMQTIIIFQTIKFDFIKNASKYSNTLDTQLGRWD